MNAVIGILARLARGLAAAAALGAPLAASAQVVLYEHDNFEGRSLLATDATPNLAPLGFNDLASSVEVRSGQWQLCEHEDYAGQCIVLNPGRHASLRALGMNDRVSSLRQVAAAAGGAAAGPAAIELYEHDDFAGRVFRANAATPNLQPEGFNDLASSLVIRSGRWALCSDAEYRGRCVALEPGSYRRLREQDMNDLISSLRPIDAAPAAPGAGAAAPGAPVLEQGMFNTQRVVFPDGCTVHYNAQRQRSVAEPRCTAGQISQADDLMARGALTR